MNSGHKIIIITAPSGSGKTSITRHLLNKFPQLRFSISAATRPMRPKEEDGVDYFFITEQDFKNKIELGDFVEWEMVYPGRYYGTYKSELNRTWNNSQVPILDIDVKGAIHVMQQYPGQCLSLFIQAPDLAALQQRLEKRGTETPETLKARLDKVEFEMGFKDRFDHVIVNDQLDRACEETEKIVAGFL
jgi:guanylate kinase